MGPGAVKRKLEVGKAPSQGKTMIRKEAPRSRVFGTLKGDLRETNVNSVCSSQAFQVGLKRKGQATIHSAWLHICY